MVKLVAHSLLALALLGAISPSFAQSRDLTQANNSATRELESDAALTCDCWLSQDAQDAGISIKTDNGCEAGGKGCVGMACRFCRETYTEATDALYLCSEVPLQRNPATTTPVTTSSGPTTPATTAPSSPSDECTSWLTPGDKNAGVFVMGDATCAPLGGVGCVGNMCRFCKTRDTPQSSHLQSCSDFSTSSPGATTTSPSATTTSPSVTTTSPSVMTTPPSASTTTPSASTTTPSSVTFAPVSVDEAVCAKWSTTGDRAVGILVSVDEACSNGGVGCVGTTTCRYCKSAETAQSKNFVACSAATIAANGGGASPTPTPTPTNPTTTTPTSTPTTTTPAPTTTPAASTPITSSNVDECAKWSTSGDRAVGVLVSSDPTCTNGGMGCIGTTCRYCKAKETTQSKNFISCSTGAGVGDATVIAPASVDVCDQYSTVGDRAVGVQVLSDGTCSTGGIGCIGGGCRYCSTSDAPQGKHLLACSAFSGSSGRGQESVLVLEATLSAGVSDTVTGTPSAGVSAGGVAGIVIGVAAAVGVMAFVVKRSGGRSNDGGALTTPMCLTQRSGSMSNI